LGTERKLDIKNNLDVVVAFGVIGIVMMIIIPLPKGLLDLLLALNMTLAIVIILITMFIVIHFLPTSHLLKTQQLTGLMYGIICISQWNYVQLLC